MTRLDTTPGDRPSNRRRFLAGAAAIVVLAAAVAVGLVHHHRTQHTGLAWDVSHEPGSTLGHASAQCPGAYSHKPGTTFSCVISGTEPGGARTTYKVPITVTANGLKYPDVDRP